MPTVTPPPRSVCLVARSLPPQEVKLLLAMVLRKWRLQLEVPDMLARAELFPYTKPAKGTGGMRLIAREQPVA